MARMPKELKHIKIIALIITAVIYLLIKNSSLISNAHNPVNGETYYVTKVVDGDTLRVSGDQKIRLIGVDTPEVHYSEKLLRDSKKSGKDIKTIQSLGAKASIFTKDLCMNKKVRLEYDVEKRDRYGRLLAYVYLEDGTFVNAKIIEEGYGQVMTIPPNVKYADYFRKLERSARDAKKGLW